MAKNKNKLSKKEMDEVSKNAISKRYYYYGEPKIKLIDCINHPNFIRISETEMFYSVMMKANHGANDCWVSPVEDRIVAAELFEISFKK